MFCFDCKAVRIGQISIQRIVGTVASGLMPKLQDAAHGHVDLAAGYGVIVLAIQQQLNKCGVYRDGSEACGIVNGFQVVQTFVVIVNVEQTVIPFQLFLNRLGLFLKSRFTFCLAHYGGNSVKQFQKSGAVLLQILLGHWACAAGQKQAAQKANAENTLHYARALAISAWKPPMAMVTPAERSASVGLVPSLTAMPAT